MNDSYKAHPLLSVSAYAPATGGNAEAGKTGTMEIDWGTPLRRRITRWVYPLKNRLQRKGCEKKLIQLGVPPERVREPEIICYGHKGFANEIFISQIGRKIARPGRVVCFGCGDGREIAMVARILKPRRIVGCDFFSYPQSWEQVARHVRDRFGIEAVFEQIDLRDPGAGRDWNADLAISFAVLEHLRDMDACFALVKGFLRPRGRFASQWGPMWYTFSGDHIAAELGFAEGFQHLLLSSDDYLQFYKNHPRNRADVQTGKPTWLEMGLHNFARYDEYLAAIERWFGPILFLKWQLSVEAFRWSEMFPDRWQKIFQLHPSLTPLDLVLAGGAVLAGEAGT